MFAGLQSSLQRPLQDFVDSHDKFRVLASVGGGYGSGELEPIMTKTLYVLDSSFNPPSRAHALLAQNAITRDRGARPARLLLLLATENADKRPRPAVNKDRLAMMTLMVLDLHKSIPNSPPIDIGVTDQPYFMDKAEAIDESEHYGVAQQVHITGFDTITRIFDSKYYSPDQKLSVLDPFLSEHRLRVTYRLGDKYGSKKDQDAYVDSISDGSREDEGMKREWRDQIEMTDDAKDGEGVSSTEARLACVQRRPDDLEKYVIPEIAQYIQEMDLYQSPGNEEE